MKFAEELLFYFLMSFLSLLNPRFSRSTCSAETNAIISSRESGTFLLMRLTEPQQMERTGSEIYRLKLFHIHAHIQLDASLFILQEKAV